MDAHFIGCIQRALVMVFESRRLETQIFGDHLCLSDSLAFSILTSGSNQTKVIIPTVPHLYRCHHEELENSKSNRVITPCTVFTPLHSLIMVLVWMFEMVE